MIRTVAFALGLCGLVATSISAQRLPLAVPEEVGLSSERLERIGEVFQDYVEEGRIAGAVGMVLRNGKLAYVDAWGMRDLGSGDVMEEDDLFKICSMTKPVASVAVMTLYEEGHFFLSDPIGRYLPALANLRVANLAEASAGQEIPTERARRQVTIHDLLRHTSGFTYGDLSNTVVDAAYREREILYQPTLEDQVAALGEIPLLYQPGTQWNYSVSVDVLGRLVEVVSGQPFDVFLRERIFDPLGMADTGFRVPDSKSDRVAPTYGHSGPDRALGPGDTSICDLPPTLFSGGAGLRSTAQDYARFAQMLLNGGDLDGARILGRKTVELMTVDHLEEGMPTGFLSPGWSFGLGFTVKTEAGLDGLPSSVGEYNWIGIQGTSFWVDPEEDLVGVFMVQIRPNRDITFRDQFKRLVYQALIG
ncbi:MAG: serine hydrolase domain-containing protein [Gemmatimonadota bacterium]|nr:serine hydrolase domain-containing protein [Gemmatimonadota bacterium]